MEELAKLRATNKNKKIVFAGGTFDLLHVSHVNYLGKLRNIGDIVVIAISRDKRVKQRKGPLRPILPQIERLTLIDSLKSVDYSLLAPPAKTSGKTPTIQIIEKLKPDIFASADKKWLKLRNEFPTTTEIRIVKREKANSTTKIINMIIKRYQS